MVQLNAVRQANTAYAKQSLNGLVCVFSGATSGIGLSTLEVVYQQLRKSTFYVLGRSAAKFAADKARLERLSPNNRLVFIEAEVTLLADIDAACKRITLDIEKVDLLYMSPGLIPLNGKQLTKEGLELCFAISYYGRMRMLVNLLPLLRKSTRPRVLSVLAAGREKSLYDEDIGLDNKWAPFAVVNHTTTMTTVSLQRFAAIEPKITLMHSYPGLVRTNIFARLTPDKGSGTFWRIVVAGVRGLVGTLMMLIGMEVEECGQRQAYNLTSGVCSPGKVWRLDSACEDTAKAGVMQKYGQSEWMDKVWEHTVGIFKNALGNSSM